MMRLYTFTLSHFAEKVRWVLDRNGVSYTERRLVPGTHMPIVRRLAPKTTVPVLLHDGQAIQGSSAIIDRLEQLGARLLAPASSTASRCAEIEALADRAFGLGGTRIFYATLLEHRGEVIKLWTQDGPSWGRAFFGVAYPIVAYGTERTYAIRPDTVQEAKDSFRRAMDTMDRALADSPYLLGDRFSRADVTVASLLAIMCRPPEHVVRWPAALPGALGEFVAELAGRPTWNHVLRMYREHRKPRLGARSVEVN